MLHIHILEDNAFCIIITQKGPDLESVGTIESLVLNIFNLKIDLNITQYFINISYYFLLYFSHHNFLSDLSRILVCLFNTKYVPTFPVCQSLPTLLPRFPQSLQIPQQMPSMSELVGQIQVIWVKNQSHDPLWCLCCSWFVASLEYVGFPSYLSTARLPFFLNRQQPTQK